MLLEFRISKKRISKKEDIKPFFSEPLFVEDSNILQ